jgi:hypothetical protein
MTLAKYLLVWMLLAIVAIGNGVLRQTTYGKAMPELTAHQLSTLLAMLACAAVVCWAHQFWPIATARQAWTIGLLWLGMTVAFEFGFGHYVAHHPWERLLADYNLLRGRTWSLFLIWMAILPFLTFKFSSQ